MASSHRILWNRDICASRFCKSRPRRCVICAPRLYREWIRRKPVHVYSTNLDTRNWLCQLRSFCAKPIALALFCRLTLNHATGSTAQVSQLLARSEHDIKSPSSPPNIKANPTTTQQAPDPTKLPNNQRNQQTTNKLTPHTNDRYGWLRQRELHLLLVLLCTWQLHLRRKLSMFI